MFSQKYLISSVCRIVGSYSFSRNSPNNSFCLFWNNLFCLTGIFASLSDWHLAFLLASFPISSGHFFCQFFNHGSCFFFLSSVLSFYLLFWIILCYFNFLKLLFYPLNSTQILSYLWFYFSCCSFFRPRFIFFRQFFLFISFCIITIFTATSNSILT